MSSPGDWHDLDEILAECLMVPCLRLAADVSIRWGRHSRPRSKSGTRRKVDLGEYDPAKNRVTVNPVLDKSWVPRYYVRSIVAHELLHKLIPPVGDEWHHAAFLEALDSLRDSKRACLWDEKWLPRLMRSRG
jgi:hypothetical protein